MNDLMTQYQTQLREFETRVDLLTLEYDNLMEHVPVDLSACCPIEAIPEPDVIHVRLEFSHTYDLPPIVVQRIKEIFNELFPDGKFVAKDTTATGFGS